MYKVPAAFLYFLSGIGAAAAVNFLTSIPASDLIYPQTIIVAGFAVPWLCASLMIAWTAAVLEEAQKKCERLPFERLSEGEAVQLRREIFRGYNLKLTTLTILAVLFIASGVISVIVIDVHRFGPAKSVSDVPAKGSVSPKPSEGKK